jgi:hypothetical protein
MIPAADVPCDARLPRGPRNEAAVPPAFLKAYCSTFDERKPFGKIDSTIMKI